MTRLSPTEQRIVEATINENPGSDGFVVNRNNDGDLRVEVYPSIALAERRVVEEARGGSCFVVPRFFPTERNQR